jgi:hypothetical protein
MSLSKAFCEVEKSHARAHIFRKDKSMPAESSLGVSGNQWREGAWDLLSGGDVPTMPVAMVLQLERLTKNPCVLWCVS